MTKTKNQRSDGNSGRASGRSPNQILHRSRLSRPRTISIKRIHMLLQMLMNWIVVKRLVLKWLYYNISDRFVDN